MEEKQLKQILKELKNSTPTSIYFMTRLFKEKYQDYEMFTSSTKLDPEFAAQAFNIKQAFKLLEALEKMSHNVSYNTSTKVVQYMDYLETGLEIYESGLDNVEFDQKFSELTKFISSHIVKAKIKGIRGLLGQKHITFREVRTADYKANPNARIDNPKKFSDFSDMMKDILDAERNK